MSVSRVSEVGETVVDVDVDVETARRLWAEHDTQCAHRVDHQYVCCVLLFFGGTIVFLFLYDLITTKIEHRA